MQIIELKEIPDTTKNKSLNYTYFQLEKLLEALRNKRLSNKVTNLINQDIKVINSSSHKDKKLSGYTDENVPPIPVKMCHFFKS
jgi:hypothetical protein